MLKRVVCLNLISTKMYLHPLAAVFLSLLLPAVSCRPSARLCATGRQAGSRTTILPSAEKRIPRAASTSRSRGGQWGRPARRSDSQLNALCLNPLISLLLLNGCGLIRLMKVSETLQCSSLKIRSAVRHSSLNHRK